ncbi:hypothetical protein RS030_6830 [Cryptosporidium xiaoi]|uniref:Uncharacterized protein n=1 Tax=Cryptosporidium xiaoi TaxID=659607 RepID=A0AAV9XXG4_9CRYT
MENFDDQGFNELNNEIILQENESIQNENIGSNSLNSYQIELNANTGDVEIKLNLGESFGDTSVDIGDHLENSQTDNVQTYESQLSSDLNEEEIGDVNIANESSQGNENSSRVHVNGPIAPPTLTTTVEPIETPDTSESVTTDNTSIPGSSDLSTTRNNNEGTDTESGTVDGTTSTTASPTTEQISTEATVQVTSTTTIHPGLIAGAVLGGIGGLAGLGVLAGLGAESRKKKLKEKYISQRLTGVNADVSLQLPMALQQTMVPVILPIIQTVASEKSAVNPGTAIVNLRQEPQSIPGFKIEGSEYYSVSDISFFDD